MSEGKNNSTIAAAPIKRNSLLDGITAQKENLQSAKAVKESEIQFTAEDVDLIFNLFSNSSFNGCITSNSLFHAYSHYKGSEPIPPAKLDDAALQTSMNNCLKELLSDADKGTINKMAKQGIDKKSFKKIVSTFEEALNSTTNKRDREDILLALEKECVELCEGNADVLLQMLHLSTVLEKKDIQPVLDSIRR